MAQSNPGNKGWGIPQKPNTCEENAAYMDISLEISKEVANPNGNIILIARLGKQESNGDLNRRRLFNIAERYRYTRNVPAEKIVVAQGERVKGFGRVEIYLNGEMIGALVIQRNRDICVDSDADDPRFYPNKKDNKRKTD
jgi:hypothetical protein